MLEKQESTVSESWNLQEQYIESQKVIKYFPREVFIVKAIRFNRSFVLR